MVMRSRPLFKTLLAMLFCCFGFSGQSQSPDSTTTPGMWKIIDQDARNELHTAERILTAPLHFDEKDWWYTGVTVGSTALCILLDAQIKGFVDRQRSEVANAFSPIAERAGRGDLEVILGAGLYVGGLVGNSGSVRLTGMQLLEGLLYAGLVNTALKVVFGRARPFTDEGAFAFHWFEFDTSHTSLPSGHTTVAFVTASVLSQRINWWPATALLYTVAASTLMQRQYDRKHWLSDTVLGAAIGIAVGNAVVRKEDAAVPGSVLIVPTLRDGSPGIGMQVRF